MGAPGTTCGPFDAGFETDGSTRGSSGGERDHRARRAILTILDGLIDAYGRRAELPWTVEALAATLRRWMEAETFEPRVGAEGLQLVDAVAARYGRFEDVH